MRSQALSDPDVSDATRVKLNSMREMVLGTVATEAEAHAASSHSLEVCGSSNAHKLIRLVAGSREGSAST